MMIPRIALVLSAASTLVVAKGTTKVTWLVGEAVLKRAGKSFPVRVRTECRTGDTLEVGATSRVELRYPDNTLLRLDENSKLVLADRVAGKPEPKLVVGKAWANVKKIGQGGTGFGVRTPTAVAAVRGTVFQVEGGLDSSSVRLYEGKVDVGTPKAADARAKGEVSGPSEVGLDQWVKLLQGEQVVMRKDGTWASSKFDVGARDPWILFNAQRDSLAGRPLPEASTESGASPDGDDPWAK
ncbi:MAG: FecR domain-containing protein [Fibrobacteria bacterium]|nr:FecR domain-containing protein [Fibrobacteria bacterium]